MLTQRIQHFQGLKRCYKAQGSGGLTTSRPTLLVGEDMIPMGFLGWNSRKTQRAPVSWPGPHGKPMQFTQELDDSTNKQEEISRWLLEGTCVSTPQKNWSSWIICPVRELLVAGRVTIPSKLSRHSKSWIFCQGAVDLGWWKPFFVGSFIFISICSLNNPIPA